MGSPYLPPATTEEYRVEQLCATVDVPDAGALRVVVETLRGPIPDRRSARDADRAESASLWSWLAAEAGALCVGGDSLEGWASHVRRDGVRGGLEHHRRRLADTLAVLRSVPADGVPLAAFADDVLGDPHALDPGRSVSRLVLGALAHARGIKPPMDAESSRLLWEAAGVAPDPLSSTVLAFGLTAGGDHPLAGVLAASAEAIEPVVLTLAQLRRWPLPALPTASEVYVFENPSLVAEATSRDW